MKLSVLPPLLFALVLSSAAQAGDKKSEALKAGGAVVAGAAVGGGTFAAVGAGGLAIAGTAVTIGAAPFIAAGAVLGLAGYGIYRVASETGAPSASPAAKSAATPPVTTAKH